MRSALGLSLTLRHEASAEDDADDAGLGAFANEACVSEGWYVLARSREVRASPRTVAVGKGEVVVYRDQVGRVHVVDPHCPHLGGHLGLGRVDAGGLTCPLHHWCWAADGSCPRGDVGGRRLATYESREAWGLVWAWLGAGEPLPFPDPPGLAGSIAVRLPPQRVRAHPHLILGNGFDPGHFGPLHGLHLTSSTLTDEAPHRLAHKVEATLPTGGRWMFTGARGKPAALTFLTHGAAVGTVEVHKPWRFGVLFTCRPGRDGLTHTQTILFLPNRRLLARALALVWNTTLEDLRQLEAQRFRPTFAPGDDTLEAYVRRTAAVPTWTGGGQADLETRRPPR